VEFLRTRLMPIPAYCRLLDRVRLNARWRESLRHRITLVRAPTGFGKTRLMAQWFEAAKRDDQRVAWLALDASDVSPENVLRYVSAAIAVAENTDNATAGIFTRLRRCASVDEIVGSIVNHLVRATGTLLLFIDDVHDLNAAGMAALWQLIEQVPESVHFVLASQFKLAVPLARLRLDGELAELGATDLAFTPDEVRHYLASYAEEIQKGVSWGEIVDRTGGWAASLAMFERVAASKGVSAAVDAIAGDKSWLTEFFSQEVFDRQSGEMQSFLLRTSSLSDLIPELCDAVTGAGNGRRMLAEADAKGIFVLNVDDGNGGDSGYRYHRLFAEFLQWRIAIVEPRIVPDLYQRAGDWFTANGAHQEAIACALKAGQVIHAAELLERRCQQLTYADRVHAISRFATQIPWNTLRRFPGVLLTLAWRATRSHRFEEAAEYIEASRLRLIELESSREYPAKDLHRLQYVQMHREMVLAAARDDMVLVEMLCQRLTDDYPDEQHPYLKGNTYSHLLQAHREQYKLVELERISATAQGMLKRSTYCLAEVGLQAAIGPSLFLLGRANDARRVLEQGREEALHYSGANSATRAVCSAPLGEMLYENNEIERADELIQEALPLVRKYGFIEQLQVSFITAARICSARNDLSGAFAGLDEGMAIAIERDFRRLRLAVLNERVRLLIQNGNVDEAVRCAASHGVALSQPVHMPKDFKTTSDELRALIWVRLAQANGQFSEALLAARHWHNFCSARGAIRSLVRWSILIAQLHLLVSDQRPAQRALREALLHGATTRTLRTFVDEGPLLRVLLCASNGDLAINGAPLPADALALELMKIFGMVGAQTPLESSKCGSVMVAALGNKEREVLSLVAIGLSNREVAERLGMTEGTVKWYMQQVYDKVGTRRRYQAVKTARQYGLISA
jgi:LuxR family maltose regulon positive regulatory protein